MPVLLAFFLSLSLMSDSSESDSVRLRDILEEEAPMMVVRVKGNCEKVLADRDSRSHAPHLNYNFCMSVSSVEASAQK